MSDEGNDWTFEEAVDYFEDEYLVSDGETIEYDSDGAALGEGLFKLRFLEELEEGESAELGWIIERFTLMRIYNEIIDTIDDMKGKEDWELYSRLFIHDEVFLFFTLADELVNGLASELLDQELVEPDRRSQSSLKTFENLKYDEKLDLLYYSGHIDNGPKSELSSIHSIRNGLTHELHNRYQLNNIEDVESRLDRSLAAINVLFEKLEGMEAFNR